VGVTTAARKLIEQTKLAAPDLNRTSASFSEIPA
jgi:hypothetical protein